MRKILIGEEFFRNSSWIPTASSRAAFGFDLAFAFKLTNQGLNLGLCKVGKNFGKFLEGASGILANML
ncbi:MAG: hypothetical protein A2V67_15625 [Deltaproteobacteria bacterium RBG_13_61_14]|nr:MAG: hypothetical protein A2V67_15625 [Deltaproteobacteria bacterium RBG_13_61_14]